MNKPSNRFRYLIPLGVLCGVASLFGMGAGQARVQGEFEVRSADGTPLMQFSARRSYLGGAGIGGLDMIKMEDVMTRLGDLVAETISKWMQGKKIGE